MTTSGRTSVGQRGLGAPFALLGVIDRVGAATMSIITPSERTAVLRVEQVLRSPEPLGDLTGAELTVDLSSLVEPGERLVLFADGWMYGESVAVREVARADPSGADDIRQQLERAQEEEPVRHLSERVRGADVVVLGVVRELKPLRRSGEWIPTSEHDPDWWIAVIAAKDVAKGRRPRGGRIEALFANSRDVQWFSAPKPDPGQEGVFLLRRERRFDAPRQALALLDQDDIQPWDHYDAIRGMLA